MADLPLSTLTEDERTLISRLRASSRREDRKLDLLAKYRDAEQRLLHMGLALPPELRMFETVINVPGMACRETSGRQELRTFQRLDFPFSESESARARKQRLAAAQTLQESWEFNNLASQQIVTHMNARTFGRTFVSVGSNEDDPEQPLIRNESPQGLGYIVDTRKAQITAVFRQYQRPTNAAMATPESGTLYLPTGTLHLEMTSGGWKIADRDDHGLGVVPFVMFVNQPWVSGGRSEMADVIGKTDAIARMITNMQATGETLALPHRWATGITEKDFVDQNGNPLPAWEAYMTVIKAVSNSDARFGSFDVAQLSNFNDAVNNMLAWCATELGLPTRYAGKETVNPASEGAIIADEIRLIKRVETMNRFDGDSWSWVMELRERFRTGKWPRRNSIRALWFNPATPTYSQRADAIVKLTSGATPILSREGAWDELGWSEERKARERAHFDAQLSSSPDAILAAKLTSGGLG